MIRTHSRWSIIRLVFIAMDQSNKFYETRNRSVTRTGSRTGTRSGTKSGTVFGTGPDLDSIGWGSVRWDSELDLELDWELETDLELEPDLELKLDQELDLGQICNQN